MSSFHQDLDDASSCASFKSMHIPMQFESPRASPASVVSTGSSTRRSNTNNDNRRMTLERIREISGNEDVLQCPIEEELFGNQDSFSMNQHRMGTRKEFRRSKLTLTRGSSLGRLRNLEHSGFDSDAESLSVHLASELDCSDRSNGSLDVSNRSNTSFSLDGSIRVEDLARTKPTPLKIYHSRQQRSHSPPRHFLGGGSSSHSIALSSLGDSSSAMSTLEGQLLEQDSLHLLRKNKGNLVGRRRQYARMGRSASVSSGNGFQRRLRIADDDGETSGQGGDERSSGGTTSTGTSFGSQQVSLPRSSLHGSRRSLFSSFHSMSSPSIRTHQESLDASLASFGGEVEL